ncbi:hypothetical protein BJX61DRAFT_533652 [Aspergillus egyptiacus]|nr:hypothetical protein BJX61DRAFT_533652 [Aspergillus egyptiacus]
MSSASESELETDAPTGQRSFVCEKCGKCYARRVHLRNLRVKQTLIDIDANTRPYSCEKCGKTFNRRDVLARHEKLHLRPPRSERPITHIPRPARGSTVGPLTAGAQGVTTAGQPASRQATTSKQSKPATRPGTIINLNAPPAQPVPVLYQPILPQLMRSGLYFGMNLNTSRITTGFLNACIHEYFVRISPALPIIHVPTWSVQRPITPLVLNMAALGSLFVSLPSAAEKGEFLWRLAQTAVAGNWQSLMNASGPLDKCRGVSLVLTDLLGRLYALQSPDPAIRETALSFQNHSFNWVQACGMESVEDTQTLTLSIPDVNALENVKRRRWEVWAAAEMQRRAVLALYFMNGLISQASGALASTRHLINPVGGACSDAAFAASTPDDWITEMTRAETQQQPMSQIFKFIFKPEYSQAPFNLSAFTVAVVLEGLQCLTSNGTSLDSSFSLTCQQLIQALLSVDRVHSSSALPSEKRQIRWQAVCIEVAMSTSTLYTALCRRFNVPLLLGGDPGKAAVLNLDLERWVKSTDAIRALLHALAIVRLVQNMPFAPSHAPHLPMSIFSAAIVLCAICLFGTPQVQVPKTPRWDETGEEFLASLRGSGEDVVAVNLLHELSSLQLALRTVTSCWGVTAQMVTVLGHLTGCIHERLSAVPAPPGPGTSAR